MATLIERLRGKGKECLGALKVLYYRVIPIKFVAPRQGANQVIVSLTTYGDRINSVHLCIKSLFNQTVKPDKIILYLAKDIKKESIPRTLKKLERNGLTIVYNCEDIRPHKKYYYCMRENPNSIVVTVDDDVIYSRHLLEKLLSTHSVFPNAVICTRANEISRGKNGKLLPYSSWRAATVEMKPTFQYLPTGVGGVLYPPKCLDPEVFNITKLKELCLNADDIWLRAMGVRNGTPVVYVFMEHPWQIPGTEKMALTNTNVTQNRNDGYLKSIEQEYGIKIDKG